MLTTILFLASLAGVVTSAGDRAAHPETTALSLPQATPPKAAVYYVDSKRGKDDNPGTLPKSAWQSLERVNKGTFASGDRLLFAGGQTFAGTLKFTRESSGVQERPIVVSSFGKGRATLQAGTEDALVLTDCAYVVVKNLNVVGCGRKNGSNGVGIRLVRTRNVELSDIEASGFRLGGVSTGGDENTRITRVYAHDNGFAGITTYGGGEGLPRSRNLYIGSCVVENNPGDPKNLDNHSGNGIVVGGVDGALIEYCEARNNGWDMPRDGNGPVGIWGWNCDRLIIQHCISHDNKSPGADGGGFDFDGGVTNSILQYNLSYNNAGCGYLLCQYPGAPPWKNNIVRYNISINDGAKNFQSGIGLWEGDKGISDALIHNNTIINPVHAVATLNDVPQMVYRNNLFLAGGDVLSGNFTRSRFEVNLYWTTGKGALYRDGDTVYATLEAWSKATRQETVEGKLVGLFADPHLALPTDSPKLPTDPRKLAAMPFTRLPSDSPYIGAGMMISNSGGQDFFGNRLLANQRPSLGAHEPQSRRKDEQKAR